MQFATAPDGVQVAWASIGKGPPVLKAPNWLNHLEYEWRNPVWGPAFAELARHWQLVRFDQRGNGLSDWDVKEISEDAMIRDMATVAEAARLERFALLGISQGCAFSIRYAVEHSQRVSCLVLLGGYLRGRLKRRSRRVLLRHLAFGSKCVASPDLDGLHSSALIPASMLHAGDAAFLGRDERLIRAGLREFTEPAWLEMRRHALTAAGCNRTAAPLPVLSAAARQRPSSLR